VIDMSWSIAGPYCGQVLGDLGADVLRVEHPGRAIGERVNLCPPGWSGEPFSPYFLSTNRNKRSLTLNLKSTEGREVLADLVRVSDIVLENFSHDAREELVDEEWAWSVNPRIIWASLTMLGRTGPGATENGLDILAQARSGIADMTGHPDGPPTKTGHSVTDYTAGSHLAIAVLAALYQRDRIGKGQLVDISLLEPAVSCLDGLPLWYSIAGETPARVGNTHPVGNPGYSILACADGHVAVALMGAIDQILVAMGRADLLPFPAATDPQFRDALQGISGELVDWVATLTVEEAHRCFRDAGAMCEPVRTLAEIWSDPQLEARGAFLEYDYGTLGRVRTIASPLHLSESPREVRHVPPGPGEHNDTILREVLGYDDDRIAALNGNGALWDW
jgi:crotonobetainyl-CoA:carnitine CoA-transferase CaiB-like acyl-CoA transferase